tara:strand:- start:109 stop:441 length:333 start_codon:yes stop_codon:yes gene_type:complete
MAAINLSAAPVSPWAYRAASVGTTWQEFQLPIWATAVVVTPDAAARVAFNRAGAPASAETPADGGAVGSHYQTIAANASFTFGLIGSVAATKIFVAADSGTANVSVLVVE